MPTYQYICPANQKSIEVRHGMLESVGTWGELCEKAEIDPGETPADAPVERIITGGLLGTVAGGTQSSASFNALPMAGCCGHPAGCRRHG